MAIDLKQNIAATPRGPAYGLSTTIATPELPAHAGALPARLQDIARNYLGARRQSGVSLLEAARWLSEARAEAQHGEWSIFLEAIGLDESRARAQIRIHEEAQRDPVFADRIVNGFLSETVARELLPLPAEKREELLARVTPPTREEVRDAKRAPAPVLETGPFWQSMSPNHPTAHLWTRSGEYTWRAACGMAASRAPSGSTEGGHCSSCVRATWPQSEPAPAPIPNYSDEAPNTPNLDDIFLRLSAHGYDRTGGTRQKGITTFYTFRDRASDLDDDSSGVLELAEGELPLWLAELDSNAAYAQAKQERYLEAKGRAEALGYSLTRDGHQFVLGIAGQAAPAMHGTLDQLIKAIEGYEKNAAKKAEPVLTIEQLDDCLPKGYFDLGYFWVTATPPTLGHVDGWRCDVHTIAQAISAAAAREKAKAEPTPWNKIAQLSYKLGAATDRGAAQDIWIAIGPLLEPQGVQQLVSSWKPDEVQAFEHEADRALQTLDTYGYTTIAQFVRLTYESLLEKAPPPAFVFSSRQPPALTPDQALLGVSPLAPIRAAVEAIGDWLMDVPAVGVSVEAVRAKRDELKQLGKHLEQLSDAPDVLDGDYDELSGMIGETEKLFSELLEGMK